MDRGLFTPKYVGKSDGESGLEREVVFWSEVLLHSCILTAVLKGQLASVDEELMMVQ